MSAAYDPEDVLGALAGQHRELAELVAGRGEREWHLASPCDGWDVADVVLHLAQTDELALASLRGELPLAPVAPDEAVDAIDAGAALAVEQERGVSGAAVGARWAHSAAALREAFVVADLHARVAWVAGDLSVRTLATTRLAECWIHTGDVAAAFGVALEPTDRLWHIARLAWRTIPYAFARAGLAPPGPVGFALTGPRGQEWSLGLEDEPPTVISGRAVDLCLVAARRVDAAATGLVGDGPDADAVLALVRTYA